MQHTYYYYWYATDVTINQLRSSHIFPVLFTILVTSVAGNQLRSSRMLGFLAVLVLLVPRTNRFLVPFRIFGATTPAGASSTTKFPPVGSQKFWASDR